MVIATILMGVVMVLRPVSGVWQKRLSWGTLLIALFTAPLWSALWPLDWLNPMPSVRATAKLSEFRVAYEQLPWEDFYLDTLEISSDQGKSATIFVSPDSSKCWIGWSEQTASGATFYCMFMGQVASIEYSWLVTQMKSCSTSHCDLSEQWHNLQ
jgi:hypothetical protein